MLSLEDIDQPYRSQSIRYELYKTKDISLLIFPKCQNFLQQILEKTEK